MMKNLSNQILKFIPDFRRGKMPAPPPPTPTPKPTEKRIQVRDVKKNLILRILPSFKSCKMPAPPPPTPMPIGKRIPVQEFTRNSLRNTFTSLFCKSSPSNSDQTEKYKTKHFLNTVTKILEKKIKKLKKRKARFDCRGNKVNFISKHPNILYELLFFEERRFFKYNELTNTKLAEDDGEDNEDDEDQGHINVRKHEKILPPKLQKLPYTTCGFSSYPLYRLEKHHH